MAKTKRTAQTPKQTRRSYDAQQRVLDLRRSSAAQPHKSVKAYKRKPKHGSWE